MNAFVAQLPIAVLGAGSWGTALAIHLARNGQTVWLWGHDVRHVAELLASRRNARFLPGAVFPDLLHPTGDMARALVEALDVLVAVPSEGFRSTLELMAPYIGPDTRLAWATKGFEPGSGRLLHQVAADVLGGAVPAAVISGPTFAREVAAGLPAAVTVASSSPQFAAHIASRLHGGAFRAYTSSDVAGVEVGGAVKNVLAIATGIADGLGFGANTRAALVTRGLAEMMRLGEALGGKRDTFMGLSGLGDLVLTCTDNQSRNRRLGLALGRGEALPAALAAIGQAVEGVQTAREVWRLAQRLHIEMPITEQVYQVLHAGRLPRDAVTALLNREQKAEL
ncbi:MAG: NAD(P)H-dependent glycerol-3-phosphate dehydrogenase [Pseudomonadota bacterium]